MFCAREVNALYNNNIQQYVEAIKLAAGSVQYKNLSIKQTFFSQCKTALRILYKYEQCVLFGNCNSPHSGVFRNGLSLR